MSSIITGKLPTHDRLGNPIYYDFRNMLQVSEVLDCEDIQEGQKMYQLLVLLYGECIDELNGTLNDLINELLWFYMADKESEDIETTEKRIYDFYEEADYIASDYLTHYGMDLTEDALELHWWKFLSLFRALPTDSQIVQRIQYRTMDTSKLTGDTRKEYEAIKASVELEVNKRREPLTVEQQDADMIAWANNLFKRANKERAGE